MKPLLLGEAPSKAGDRYHGFPLSGAPATRICQLMGWDTGGEAPYWTLREHFDTLNAVERFADAYPWRVETARSRWRAYRAENPGDLIVVALGRRAADAIGIGDGFLFGEWQGGPDGHGYVEKVAAPHTSGRSRIMNEQNTRDLLVEILTRAEEKARAAQVS